MRSVKPKYRTRSGEGNYSAGYCGFSYTDNSVVSLGIAEFTRAEYFGIIPSHAFLVVDEQNIIEATGKGVHFEDPAHYFDNPHCVVFFRKPVALSPDRVEVIINEAVSHLGEPYDYSLFLGFLFTLERTAPFRKYPSIFNRKNAQVCSELVAGALNKVEDYSNKYPLSVYHPSKVTPVELFKSEELFEEIDFDLPAS